MLEFEKSLTGKKILVTGHTGFTGGWVCTWLNHIGADVFGFALKPDTTPSMFRALNLEQHVTTTFGDIRDYDLFLRTVKDYQPEVILHLAAQPLVRRSYTDPLYTFQVNTQGTLHVLEVGRLTKSVQAILCVTTDKVYKNNEWHWPYRENDPLGGNDPYSGSKAAAEMVIQSYMASYPSVQGLGPATAIARGGNIIGGGDWSEDRLIPDFVRAVTERHSLTLRYPEATRPWQHVLALVHGYLVLIDGLIGDNKGHYTRPWNLGPQETKQHSVHTVLELMCDSWERPVLEYLDNPLPESNALALDSSLANNLIGWQPAWDTARVVEETARWYKHFYDDSATTSREITLQQIAAWRECISA